MTLRWGAFVPQGWKLELTGMAAADAWGRSQELARAADYTVLVAPETAGILARQTRDLQAAGARILGSCPAAIDLTGDKARLAEWLLVRGIDTPPSRTIVPCEPRT